MGALKYHLNTFVRVRREGGGGGVSHWALAHREVTLSHNYGKLKNVIMLDGYKHS